MISSKLARVQWRMGQTLLPEHFQAQEQALLANVASRFSLVGLPFYGIGELAWNESLLAEGILHIRSMSVILPSGEFIDIPGNASAPPFNMNETGLATVSIYFHLMGEKPGTEALGAGRNGAIQRQIYDVVINSDESTSGAIQTFGLADFTKNVEGTWALSPDYIPALLQVGTSPYLRASLVQIDKQLDNFHYKLVRKIAATYLSGESLQGSKKVLQAVYKLQGFLQNLNTQIHFHPYFVLEALKDFYIDLCFYQSTLPEHVKSAYLHHDIATCFNQIIEPILTMLQQVRAEAPYVPFESKDGKFVIRSLPDKVTTASQIYLLIQKERVGENFSLEGFKLASAQRLSIVHQLSLAGVSIERIARPPFQHSFGPEVDFYRIVGGEEWDYVLKDRSIAFYDQPRFKQLKAYFYWRDGS